MPQSINGRRAKKIDHLSVKLCTAKLCLQNQNKTYRESYPKSQRLFHKRESNSRALSLKSLQTTSNASTHTLFLSLGLEPTNVVGCSVQILFKGHKKPRGGFCANCKLDSSLDEIPKSDPLRIKSFHSVLKLLTCFQKLQIMFGFLQKHHNSQLQNETSATAAQCRLCSMRVTMLCEHRKHSKVVLPNVIFGQISTTNYDLSIHKRSTSKIAHPQMILGEIETVQCH